jgi:hypothetical protein
MDTPTAAVENFEAAPAVQESKPARQARRAPVMDDDDDMFRGDAPGSAPAKPASPKASPAPAENFAAQGNVRVLKPFKSRAEVLERMGGMYGSFFRNAKWYTDESGKMVLKFQNQFEIDNMTVLGGLDAFVKAVSQVMGRAISKQDVSCECESVARKDDIIEKILEAAEE